MNGMEGVRGGFIAVLAILMSSFLLIIFALIYFLITLWIINFGAEVLDMSPDGSFVVLSASIITLGVIIGSALAKRN
jgi:hypothetical protein